MITPQVVQNLTLSGNKAPHSEQYIFTPYIYLTLSNPKTLFLAKNITYFAIIINYASIKHSPRKHFYHIRSSH